MTETIFAQATPFGVSGVAIIRISGPDAFEARRIFATGSIPAPRTVALRKIIDPADGETIDEAVVLSMPGPASFTGEDVLELQVHGSLAVCRRILGTLSSIRGFRHAEAGEFARRALMHGRISLSEAEGLADLLTAETDAQHRQAMKQLEGRVERLCRSWREDLVGVLALIEAGLDFSDEEIPEDCFSTAADSLGSVILSMTAEEHGSHIAERLRGGFEVALVGAPNVGKSTLLNAISGRQAALTSPVPGTTRDVVEVRLDLRGIPVSILDMAGFRETSDTVEALGIEHARKRAADADLRIFLQDDDQESLPIELHAEDVVVQTKSDLRSSTPAGIRVSALTGEGVNALLDAIYQVVSHKISKVGDVTNGRQRDAVSASLRSLRSAVACLEAGSAEVASAEIQAALRSIDFLCGRVDVEAVLDSLFGRFCIGK